MLQPISWIDVPNVWLDVQPLLQRVIDRGQGDWTTDDIYHHLMLRDMQLWTWVEDGAIVACCVSQITSYPRRKVCQLPFIAGKAMHRWLECEEVMIEWARQQGCTQLEGFCRDGWLRVLQPRNWFKAWVTMRKDI